MLVRKPPVGADLWSVSERGNLGKAIDRATRQGYKTVMNQMGTTQRQQPQEQRLCGDVLAFGNNP